MKRSAYLGFVLGLSLAGLIPPLRISGNPPPDKCAQFTQILAPATEFKPDATVNVSVMVRNCGSLTWPQGKVFLSHHWYQGNQLVKWDDYRVPVAKDIFPNHIATFTASIRAPYTEGDYTVRFDLVLLSEKGEEWFSKAGNATGNLAITVKTPVLIGFLDPDILFSPLLNSIYPTSLRPKVKMILQGEHFSTKTGKVLVVLPSGKTIEAAILDWWDKIIVAQLPDIAGETSGIASVYVEKHTSTKSNALSRSFKADEEIIVGGKWTLLKCGDPHACLKSCGNIGGGMISAYHYNQWSWGWPFSVGCWDNDRYAISNDLQNGWCYESHKFWYEGYDNVSDSKLTKDNCIGGACPWAKLTFTGDATSKELIADVQWHTGDVWHYIYYYLTVYIKGPKGAPY